MLILLSMVVSLTAFLLAMLWIDPERRKKAIAVAVIAPCLTAVPATASHSSCPEGMVPGWKPETCVPELDFQYQMCDVAQFVGAVSAIAGMAALLLAPTVVGGALAMSVSVLFGAASLGMAAAGACSFDRPAAPP